jgi:transposase
MYSQRSKHSRMILKVFRYRHARLEKRLQNIQREISQLDKERERVHAKSQISHDLLKKLEQEELVTIQDNQPVCRCQERKVGRTTNQAPARGRGGLSHPWLNKRMSRDLYVLTLLTLFNIVNRGNREGVTTLVFSQDTFLRYKRHPSDPL